MTLPLFPLNLVLFPTAQLPLHIFEARYKQLVGSVLQSDSEFGINLVEDGNLYPVGCTAKIVDVTQRYGDGRLDIVIEGMRRYRLVDINETDQTYAHGETEPIEDDDTPIDDLLVDTCASLYNQIVELVYGTSGPRFETNMHKGQRRIIPSFYMAPKSGLAMAQKQHILEMESENARLEFLVEHLQQLVPNIKKADHIQKVIQSDGYFPPRG